MNSTAETSAYDAVMRRAIDLAAQGPAHDINPHVGCVVLDSSGEIIAEGWHKGSGTPHAEIDALSKISADQAVGSTFVVTLEPCNHTGKTGPCSQALIDAGVGTVVFAATDPGHASSGGAKRLTDAGITVIPGILENDVNVFLEEWMTAARLLRPHVTVKWASSLDGRVAAADGTSQWITGSASLEKVHLQRSKADAIMVGTGTVIADNPSLTARTPSGELYPDQPIPVVIGTREIPQDSKVFQHPHAPLIETTHDLSVVLNNLFERGVRSVYVEGGPTLISAFIAGGFVDRFYMFQAPTLLGGPYAAVGDLGITTLSERLNLRIESVEHSGADLFITAHPQEAN
jgi:diaminohydroxyphosphoribosylaminopyrimidine deaminase/5-amino-6-(5-phosphoribosylamino)uracil reductase